MSDDKEIKKEVVKFLQKRGFAPDAAVYVNFLMRVRQEGKFIADMAKSPEVQEASKDFVDYIEREIQFFHERMKLTE